MTNKVIVMTGATSGFGRIVAWELAQKGATVVVLSRNSEKSDELIDSYRKKHPKGKGKIESVSANMSSFGSLTNACGWIKTSYPVIDQLILNAGIMNFKRKESSDQIEEVFQVNLLAPTLLIGELIGALQKSEDARIILTTSGLHQGTIQFSDIEFQRGYSNMKSYRQSKLGMILLTRFLSAKLSKSGIGIYCQHPGVIKTKLARDSNWFVQLIFKLISKPVEQGTKTLLHLSLEPKADLISGEYYAEEVVKETSKESYDMATAERLLDVIDRYLKPHSVGVKHRISSLVGEI